MRGRKIAFRYDGAASASSSRAAASGRICCSRAATSSSCGMSRRPASLTITPRVERDRSVAPSWRSSRCTAFDTCDGVTFSARAAPVMAPQR